MGYWFFNDQPGTFGHGVTSTKVAFEFDTYADWKFYKSFTLSAVGAFADPHKLSSKPTTGRALFITEWCTLPTLSEKVAGIRRDRCRTTLVELKTANEGCPDIAASQRKNSLDSHTVP